MVDEIADLDDGLKETIKRMVKLYRACGLYPILATNDPVQSAILVKSNLATRVCFRVPSFNDSITVLGNKGAEKLPDEIGRGLILWKGRLTEFQSFTVEYPRLSEAALQELAAQVDGGKVKPAEAGEPDEITQLAESIRAQWSPGMTKSAVSRLLGKSYSGASWTHKVTRVIDHLISSSSPTKAPDSDAVAG